MGKKYWLYLIGGFIFLSGASFIVLDAVPTSSGGKRFENGKTPYAVTLRGTFAIAMAYLKANRKFPKPAVDLSVESISTRVLLHDQDDSVYRLCHSTMLIRLDNKLILTDPLFSNRASPVQWFGPERFHLSPIAIDDLPEIDVVLVSHDHYDHLDKNTIKSIHPKVKHFVTPLGVSKNLVKWGVPKEKIIELNWWGDVELSGLKFTATPAQHFSGRGLMDGNETLWSSWVIESTTKKLYFSGDTGYFDGFKEIGARLGPFDITMIESGAYNSLWEAVHMMPDQTIQAHIDLKGRALLPIHNSTFDLALHDWFEPLEVLYNLAEKQNINLLTPKFGEKVSLNSPKSEVMWWRDSI